MAKKSSELVKRVTTGILGGGALIALVLHGDVWGAWVLAAVMSLGMLLEFSAMAFSLKDRRWKQYFLVLAAAVIFFVRFHDKFPLGEVLVVVFLILFALFMLTAWQHAGVRYADHVRELFAAIFALMYLVALPTYLPLIRSVSDGANWVILFLLINWVGDTAAYFVGKKFGRHRLYPQVSPNKSVEGAAAGLVGSIVVAYLYCREFLPFLELERLIGLTIAVSVAAQAGDFCESLIKRAFDKKDSGSILPGHGGLLDRFDGVVFSLPIMYICIAIFA